jgi:hypothetical protein
VSALEAARHRSLPRGLSRHLVSDDDLRRLIARRQTTALHVMLYVRKRAALRGKLHVAVTNIELERELGVDRRQIQRAKAYLREQGFPIIEREGRHRGPAGKSGSLACMFVLDRRDVEPLKPYLTLVRTEEHGGAVPEAVLIEEENTPPTAATSSLAAVGGVAARARGGPPVDPLLATSTPEGAPATEASACGEPPRAGAVERPQGLPAAAELEPELSQLRRWWSAARQPALSGERAAAVLDRAVAAVVGEGGSPFKARLARSLLERELGLGQLTLADPQPSVEPDTSSSDGRDTTEGKGT